MNCPQCGNSYAPGNRFCGYCGYELAQTTAAPVLPDSPSPTRPTDLTETPSYPVDPPAEPAPAPQDIICPRCHRANDADSAFCFACGFPLMAGRQEQPAREGAPAFEIGAPGGFWFRSLAYIIDSLVVVLPLVFLWIIFGQPVPENFDQILEPPEGYDRLQVLVLFLTMAYDTALITYFATTLGKRAFGLYVVRTDGSRVGFVRALARHMLTAISANLTLGLIFLFILFRQDKRGLHDLICDTVVIRRYR
jgi:uncharacterized RDD family membrane protein YckC/ribosomal protein L37E